jgi:hypothetical protein
VARESLTNVTARIKMVWLDAKDDLADELGTAIRCLEMEPPQIAEARRHLISAKQMLDNEADVRSQDNAAILSGLLKRDSMQAS